MFHVRGEKRVNHENRDIEFIALKAKANELIERKKLDPRVLNWACEHWCTYLAKELKIDRVEVSEDGENGAIFEPEDEYSGNVVNQLAIAHKFLTDDLVIDP